MIYDIHIRDCKKIFFRSVGGIRASLYNAVTLEEVAKLAGFMRLFESEYLFDNLEKDASK